jgi:hypothetical protein
MKPHTLKRAARTILIGAPGVGKVHEERAAAPALPAALREVQAQRGSDDELHPIRHERGQGLGTGLFALHLDHLLSTTLLSPCRRRRRRQVPYAPQPSRPV